jgi:hypothetical protein
MAIRVGEKAIAKLRERGIEEWEVYEAYFSRHVIIRNKKNRAGSHRLIGRTENGRILTFPMRRAHDMHDVWDIVTGWSASEGERTIWTKRAR